MATNKKTPLHNETLFTAEEWSRITPGELWYQDPKREQPVTVLGHTFKNDDERRQWFREELRKKLPELKQMDGYPIGEDDDIINLSDPPYYTACPNPWLNDFIDEWEQEKKKLEAEGKRDANTVVTEPYASDVSEGKNNPIYMAHSYHTKVPHPAIMRYILHYTQPGDIVFDGFAGTGMTGVASQMCGISNNEKEKINLEFKNQTGKFPIWGTRRSILGDLSPIASFIAYNYNTPVDIIYFEKHTKSVISEIENECGWMYETKHTDGSIGRINYVIWSDVYVCPNCGNELTFYDVSVDKEKKVIKDTFFCPFCGSSLEKRHLNKAHITTYEGSTHSAIEKEKSVPVLINYTAKDGKRYEKRLDTDDISKLQKIEDLTIPYWYPTNLLPPGDKTSDPINHLYKRVCDFYTKRALYILAAMRTKFTSKELWLLTSIIEGSSKMNRERPFGLPSKLSGTLYIGSLVREIDVISFAKRKIKRYVDSYFKKKNGNALIQVASANSEDLNDNKIDYIFTDPPFGANLMYSELNILHESWLKVRTNNKEEAIVNKSQHKSLFDYQRLMTNSLKEFYRILKPGKWLTMEFSNTSASVWNSIQNALQGVGFVVANVASLDKKQGSYNAVTSTTAVKQDLVISCYKPSDEFTRKIEESADKRQNVWDFIGEQLQQVPGHIERGNATTTVIERSPKILYDRLISYYVQHGYSIPMDAQQFQQGLKERFLERDGMFFTAKQAAEYEEKKKHTTGVAPMGLIVSDEANGIEWLKHELKEPKTYQEISPEWMAAINGQKKGDVIPELKTILEENFIEDEQGKWHIPDLEKAIDLEKLHHKSLMREFNLYKEQAQKPRARIREVRVEALREGFKECFKDKDFQTILLIADKIPQNILTEDEQLLQYYDIASMRA